MYPLIDHNNPLVIKHGLLDNSPRFSSMMFPALNLLVQGFPSNKSIFMVKSSFITKKSMSTPHKNHHFLWVQSPLAQNPMTSPEFLGKSTAGITCEALSCPADPRPSAAAGAIGWKRGAGARYSENHR